MLFLDRIQPKRFVTELTAALLLVLAAGTALADNELALYVFRDNIPAEGLTVTLDGGSEKSVAADGSVFFSLSPGAHSIQIKDNGTTLHTFRFDSAASQYVDISVLLLGLERPRVRIEPHFKNETAAVRSAAATGTILGRLTSDGQPLAGADVVVARTGTSTITDSDGNYLLTLPRGIYELEVSHPTIGTETLNIRVVANVERGASFSIAPVAAAAAAAAAGRGANLDIPAPVVEEIFVVARYNPVALGESERYTEGVTDSLGIGELTRFGDTNLSSAVLRIPAVTVLDDRFIFIRGLGGRYISTTLNGATMPSTNPNRRTVPLDLFPTNMVRQLDVKKTFIASMPGESTGGNLVINTRTFPAEGGGQLTFDVGATSGLTGDSVWADPIRTNTDWLGYDDGTREDNSPLRAISDVLDQDEFLPPNVENELRRVGGLLMKDDWDPIKRTANPLVKLGASYGNVWDTAGGSEWGFFLAGNYKNEWTKRVGERNTYQGEDVTPTNLFDFEEYTNKVDLNGLLSLGLTTGNSAYTSNTLYSHVGEGRALYQVGFVEDSGFDSIQSTVDWVERGFFSQQFTGNHIFGANEDWITDWQFTVSRATRLAPQRRDVRYDLQGNDGVYNLLVPDLAKRYDDLVDDNFDGSVDFDYNFDIGDNVVNVFSFGAQYIRRERDADSETYGYNGGNPAPSAPNLRVDDAVNETTITGNPSTGYAFDDITINSDSYDAKLKLGALYGSWDAMIADVYQVIGGVRYENYDQQTNTFETSGEEGPVTSRIKEKSLLPSLSFNWFFGEQQQVRFGASKTVSRPDFKETSNATFYDPEFDAIVRGNPRLTTSEAYNVDARYEYYWDDRDSLSFAAFYKALKDPIERVAADGSGTVENIRTFINADDGKVYGIEMDGRKEFGLNESLSRTFFVYGNVSLIDSKVNYQGRSRPLQGQPEYTANLALGYDDVEWNQEATLLLNQNGNTIVDVGINGAPDVIKEPRLELGFRYTWYFADNWQLRVKLDNLLDDETEFTQGGKPFLVYKTGREYQLGVTWDF